MSTQKQAYEGESLEIQASICTTIAQNNGWRIAHAPWKESFSGRKSERPVFKEVLAFLDEHPGKIQFYLFRSIDRFTRGGVASYDRMKHELSKRGVQMVDSQGVIQPSKNTLEDVGFEYEWSRQSPSEISEAVVATASKHEVTTILTRLISQEIRLRQRGYKIRRPTDGFVNAKIAVDGRRRTIEQPDPERAKFYITMFEMRASGQYSDAEICARVNAMGYRSRVQNRWDAGHQTIVATTGGSPLIPKRLQEAIRRPIYCGVICEKWTHWKPVKAAYPGLVSMEIFNAANRGAIFIHAMQNGELELLYDHQPNRRLRRCHRNNPLFPYRRVVVCPTCLKPFSGSSPKGRSGQRFPTYHCSRGHKYYGVNAITFHAAVKRFVEGLRFDPAILPILTREILDCYRWHQEGLAKTQKEIDRGIALLERQKVEAITAFRLTTSEVVRQGLEAQADAYDQQIREARRSGTEIDVGEDDIAAYTADVKAVLEHPSLLLENADNPLAQQTLYSLVFEDLPTYEEISLGTAKYDWIFYLLLSSDTSKPVRVHSHGLKWNQIEKSIRRWKYHRECIDAGASDTKSLKSPNPHKDLRNGRQSSMPER